MLDGEACRVEGEMRCLVCEASSCQDPVCGSSLFGRRFSMWPRSGGRWWMLPVGLDVAVVEVCGRGGRSGASGSQGCSNSFCADARGGRLCLRS